MIYQEELAEIQRNPGGVKELSALLDGVTERDYLWAYASVKSRTAEVLVDGDAATLIRRRETYEDLVANEQETQPLAPIH